MFAGFLLPIALLLSPLNPLKSSFTPHYTRASLVAQTVKASVCSAGDLDSIPGSGRSPGERNGKVLQYFCLENPMDRGALKATVCGVTESRTRLSDFTYLIYTSERAPLVAQRLKSLPAMRETWVLSLGQEDPLEKEMLTHSSILAWRIPWMEESGGLPSTESQSRA